MNMRSFMGASVTNHMDRITGVAFLEMMMAGEQVPVRALTGHYHPCPFTKGTYAVECSDYCGSYEFRPVGDPLHSLSQRFRDLECDHVELLFFHGQALRTTEGFKLQGIVTL
jgi:hypothetical protein